MNRDINELARQVHSLNAKWWTDPVTLQPIKRNQFTLLALVISELSEALEGERKDLMDDKLPHRKMAEVEMADAKIRLLDFAAGFRIRIKPFQFSETVPDNKGHAIFKIMESVSEIPSTYSKPEDGIHIGKIISKIESYCTKFGYDLEGAFWEKMKYNETREDHTHEARKIAGGKQF